MGFSIDNFPVLLSQTGSATSATSIIASFNAQKYRSGLCTLSGFGSATVKVQGSHDNSTWFDIPTWSATSASPSLATSRTSADSYLFNCIATYVRVYVTSYSSGTIAAKLDMSAWPLPVPFSVTAGSAATVSGTEAHDAALSSAPVPIGGYAKSTAPTNVSADGDAVNAWFDLAGRQAVWDGASSLTVDATGAAAHDAAASGAPVLMGGYAKATAPTAVSADGDAVNAWFTTTGEQNVVVRGAAAHDAAASGAPILLGGYAKATAPSAVSADGDATNLWCTTTGALHVADGAGSLTVDATGAAAHDAAASGAPLLLGGYAKASAPSAVSADGDVCNLWCTTTGELNIIARGAVAHDGVASGAPVLLGGYASAASPSDVSADGDVARLWTTVKGALNIADAGGSITVDATGAAAHDAVTSGAPVRIAGKAQNTLPSAVSADADVCDISTTQKGQVRVIHDADANQVGATLYSNTALNATKAEVTDTANSRVYNIFVYNPSNAVAYLQIFDLDADDVTVGSTTPTQVLAVPTLIGMNFSYPTPKKFTTGLTIAGTTTATGSTNPSTALVVAIDYIV